MLQTSGIRVKSRNADRRLFRPELAKSPIGYSEKCNILVLQQALFNSRKKRRGGIEASLVLEIIHLHLNSTYVWKTGLRNPLKKKTASRCYATVKNKSYNLTT